jgi:FkbM family methyltransferase
VAHPLLVKVAKLLKLLSRAEYRRGLPHKVAAAVEHEDMVRALHLGTLIDVGANVGQFSLLARTFHPHVLVHAFEPLSGPAARYERLLSRDHDIHLHRVAAGDTPGAAKIHVSGRPDSSSLLPITDLQNTLFPGTAEVMAETIKVVRADDVLDDAVLPDPILIKLDVQGFELTALRGMPNLLKRARYVYAEVSFRELYKGQPLAHEIVAWLATAGFRMAGAYNPTTARDGSAIQADILFERATPPETGST